MDDCYRTFFRRLGAGVIDGIVLLPVAILHASIEPATELFAVLWATFLSIVFVVYFALMHARYGQTLGKMATRVLVIDVSEKKSMTLGQAFRREMGIVAVNACALLAAIAQHVFELGPRVSTTVVSFVDLAALLWFLLEVVSMLSNPKRRALHDFIAGTVVLKTA
jgi:uncharacterized RDD family membrane protein YckC